MYIKKGSSMPSKRLAFYKIWQHIPLWKKVIAGLLLGMITGIIFGEKASFFKPLGDLFINGIMMLIVPLVFSSLVIGIAAMRDPKKMGRLGTQAIFLYLMTTAIAIAIGLTMSTIFQPGAGVDANFSTPVSSPSTPSLINILLDLVPKNPVAAMAEGNVLQIIVFAVGLGISLTLVGEKGEPVVRLFDGLAEAMYKLTSIVMAFAPFGVFGLIAHVAGQYGLEMLLPLAKVIGVVYLACILHVLVVYSGFLLFFARLSPIRYLQGSLDAVIVAYSSASSVGTLPVTMRCAQKNLGISESFTSFLMPVGATINMDGTAIYQGVVVLFIAQLMGVDLSAMDYVMIVATATLASIGTAGVPGAGLIMLSIILVQVGLPLEAIAVIAGIDRILDMARTSVNIAGDLMVASLIGKKEGEIDEVIYNSPNTV